MDKEAQIVRLLRKIESECENKARSLAQMILEIMGYEPDKDR